MMRVLISGVGTRGDVQPVLALAVALRAQGHTANLGISPNFVEWATQLGFEATPVGVVMRTPAKSAGTAPTPQIPMSHLISDLVADQFTQLKLAAKGCDLIVGVGSYQFAARSIAEWRGVPYINAVFAALSIPTPDLPPGANPGEVWLPGDRADNLRRWDTHAQIWNDRFLARINHNREELGLLQIIDVTRHILGDEPLLAADPLIGPVPDAPGMTINSTGAWILADSEPLSPELEAFLKEGPPPIYFGFGSMPAPQNMPKILREAARSVGRRALISQGWADFDPISDAPDCLLMGDVNQQALFPRVATVVHHGGAGTTVTSARAGVPQVITPMFSDQFYWGLRVHELEIGTFTASQGLRAESLATALEVALAPEVAVRADRFAGKVVSDGAAVAAREIIARCR